MGKKDKEKGKLDKSATVNLAGTIYNVHPKVKATMDGLYQEYMQMTNVMKQMVPFEEKERNILNKIVTTFEPMENIPPELVGIIQDIKDTMKSIQPAPKEENEPGPENATGSSNTQGV